ncbi:hypothetical protein CL629_04150 [bacterium]|nr:hypothetical protein [bacterium]|tara:strand:+ start:3509 stop:4063 length:555 start_codon:yes stop_codon:yes gene_type:complete
MKAIRIIDPIYWLLRLILRNFINAELTKVEKRFVQNNIDKHRGVIWVNIIVSVFVFLGLSNTPEDTISLVITSLIAPVMVMGAAWFAISFGGIPQKLINIAMSVTFWMFTAFVVSLSAMFIAVGFVTNPYLWPALIIIYLGALFSCIMYDTSDGLKAGLDETQLKHSRAALAYYEKEGIRPEDE